MSPDAILERAQWDTFWLPPGSTVVERPELAYAASPVDQPFLNCVHRARLARGQVEAAIAEVLAAHAGRRSRWLVTDGSRPSGIERDLAAAGYAPGHATRGAILAVADWRDAQTGHTVRRVEDRRGLDDLYEVVEAVFGPGRRPEPAALEAELAQCAPRGGRVHRYVAYAGDRPVAAGGLGAHPALGIGVLWAGGTVPEARGRGAYRALLQARIHDACRLGLDAVGLYARVETSLPIVRRLGFSVHGAMVHWERAA